MRSGLGVLGEQGVAGALFDDAGQQVVQQLLFARREHLLWYGADMPYGGYKSSGVGRQNGIEGFEQYLETKAVAFPATAAEGGTS